MNITDITISVSVTDHASAAEFVLSTSDIAVMPVSEVIQRVITLNNGLRQFWSNATGWAPIEAAELLNKSRLDWQVQLSETLLIWSTPPEPGKTDSEGRLILAWANLGSLLEGTLKLFLSVWYQSYVEDVEAIKKKGKLLAPDSLMLNEIRDFFRKQIWDDSFDKIAANIQKRRNAIHAFKDKDIGTWEDFYSAVKDYLAVLRYINFRLPYPDDVHIPVEW